MSEKQKQIKKEMEGNFGPRLPVLMFSSSHMTERHYFETALKERWDEDFSTNPYFEFPQINAVPGRKLDEKFVDEFATITENLEKRTILLLMLGDNNLGCKKVFDLEKGSRKILSMVDEILNIHSKTEHLLSVQGLLPRWSHTPLQAKWHQKTDNRLFRLTKSYFTAPSGDRLGFVYSTGWFMEGSYLIRDYFERDGVHLRADGAGILAFNSMACASRLVENWRQGQTD